MTDKPKLVLHICCAPDEAWVVHTLGETHELYCYFSNPNIEPAAEYQKRLEEARKVAERYGVPFSAPPYAPQSWEDTIRGHEHTSEGGERCARCFLLRLRDTARFCKQIDWPAFTTVMSISPHKRIAMLDEAGARAAHEYGVRYEPCNFKKRDGFKKSIELSNELGLYRQDYCGCRLSRAERDVRRARQ